MLTLLKICQRQKVNSPACISAVRSYSILRCNMTVWHRSLTVSQKSSGAPSSLTFRNMSYALARCFCLAIDAFTGRLFPDIWKTLKDASLKGIKSDLKTVADGVPQREKLGPLRAQDALNHLPVILVEHAKIFHANLILVNGFYQLNTSGQMYRR